jgi:hypothetical protein
MIDCPSARVSGSAIKRAVKSVLPPGGVGTTKVMGRCGNLACAKLKGLKPAANADAPKAIK